jgi:hypothetical protein
LLVNIPSPYFRVPTCPFTLEVLQAREHAPIPYPLGVFTFGLGVESIKEFGSVLNSINQICLKKPPLDTTLPYLYYTNAKTTEYNKKTFQNTVGETFKFIAQDIHLDICPVHFQLLNLPNRTFGVHHELFFKRHMLVELCVGNYYTSNGIVNGVDETFEEYTKTVSKPVIWINFHNPHIGFNTRLENSHICKTFPRLNKN